MGDIEECKGPDGRYWRIDWRVDNAARRFHDCAKRPIVSQLIVLDQLGLRVKLMLQLTGVAARGEKRQQQQQQQQQQSCHVRMKVIQIQSKGPNLLRFRLFLGGTTHEPMTHDFAEQITSGHEFLCNWEDALEGKTLKVAAEIFDHDAASTTAHSDDANV
eukprot:NODE_4446_length_673_cov_341.501618.p1 GENE.NODE_4446_length_673_cov_341.501618~~NODE_4446_length_673_cov_341.501618.p1  ORF type:complete len:160 (+),score=48.66 NODE_4446_length_673_cov_341.501618:3-482(+)